jgi:adenylate kinase family enzyme
MRKWRAVLLLGPTGAGKSPLGDRLEKNGLWGRLCAHFDFGANLRAAEKAFGPTGAGAPPGSGLTAADLAVIRISLATGALLENENFPIAAKILGRFAAVRRLTTDDLLILNGLPRHAGQARDLEHDVDMVAVISLECSADVIRERIRRDTGGDRTGRPDDAPGDVENKLRIYAARTLPLLEFYRERGVPVVAIPVAVKTQSQEIIGFLAENRAGVKG